MRPHPPGLHTFEPLLPEPVRSSGRVVIGSTLDKYEVLEKVGEGGMATVYRGRHATLNRDVAIKVLHPHLSSSSRNRKRFAREARAIEHLRHPNILEIFDYSGLDAEECYIVTEFVSGETLSSLLWRRGRLPSELVAAIGRDLARALAYAHREAILHRDLKPDNVMVRGDGTIKLMDFGIARFLDESQVTMTGALVGSPAFMSPEQAREGKLDTRSDLFSLGTVLFYLVTGTLPFAGSNPSVILKNVIEANRPNVAELAPTISASLADVIERLLSTDRDGRFPTADDVVAALGKVLEESGVDPEQEPWSIYAYTVEPEAWERRLDAHLREHLLSGGKALLARGDHLAALRMFNRLLSMDGENAEVLALVQGLHGQVRPRRRVGWLLGGSATVVVVTAIAAVVLWSRSLPPGPPPDAAPRPTPAPVEAAAQAVEAAAQADPPAPVVRGPDPVPGATPGEPAPAAAQVLVPTPTPPPPLVRRPQPQPAVVPVDPVPAPAPPLVVAQNGTGKLHLSSPDFLSAEVFTGSTRIGMTNKVIEIPSGKYHLVVRSLYVQEYELDVEVGPGETVQQKIPLKPKPWKILLEGWEGDCRVTHNGQARGTVATLDAVLLVDRPHQPQAVVLTCGSEPHEFRWSELRTDVRVSPP